jgi:hypothetical protein
MTTKNMIQADYRLDESEMHAVEMHQQQILGRSTASNDKHKKEPAEKLVDPMQDNDEINCNGERSKTKPLP